MSSSWEPIDVIVGHVAAVVPRQFIARARRYVGRKRRGDRQSEQPISMRD